MSKNEKTFEQYYCELADPLFRYSFFKVNDRETALDLVQDTFARALAYMQSGKQIDAPKAFLYQTLRNLIVDQYREKEHDSLDFLAESGFEPSDTVQPDLVDQLDGVRALELIAKLPPDVRDVIFFRFVDDLSFAEIAVLTGESVNTLTVRAHRGIKKLKEIATQHYGT